MNTIKHPFLQNHHIHTQLATQALPETSVRIGITIIEPLITAAVVEARINERTEATELGRRRRRKRVHAVVDIGVYTAATNDRDIFPILRLRGVLTSLLLLWLLRSADRHIRPLIFGGGLSAVRRRLPATLLLLLLAALLATLLTRALLTLLTLFRTALLTTSASASEMFNVSGSFPTGASLLHLSADVGLHGMLESQERTCDAFLLADMEVVLPLIESS